MGVALGWGFLPVPETGFEQLEPMCVDFLPFLRMRVGMRVCVYGACFFHPIHYFSNALGYGGGGVSI